MQRGEAEEGRREDEEEAQSGCRGDEERGADLHGRRPAGLLEGLARHDLLERRLRRLLALGERPVGAGRVHEKDEPQLALVGRDHPPDLSEERRLVRRKSWGHRKRTRGEVGLWV